MNQNNFAENSRVFLLFLLLLFFTLPDLKAQVSISSGAAPQTVSLESLLKPNSYELTVTDGKLSGAGSDFLMEASSNAQFFALGEPHNAKQVPEITSMLFQALHERRGFNYLALEQDPVVTQMVSAKSVVGKRDYIVSLANQYPNAFTFITDQELEMIAEAGSISKGKGNRIWGVDQAFGALHILNRLKELAPNNEVRDRIMKLIKEVKEFETKRFVSRRRYMSTDVPKPDELKKLMELYKPKKGSESEFLITQLLTSIRIYENNGLAGKGELAGYESSYEREENMKALFMHRYRQAQAAGEINPKVLLKLGHVHIIRGTNWFNIFSLGNFVSEFARSNNMNSFHLAMYSNNTIGDYAWIHEDEDYKPLAKVSSTTKWTVIDFRPLRKYAHAGRIEKLRPEMRRIIYGFDAALLIGSVSLGTFKLTAKK
jgi:hypothetical protein